MNKLKFKMLYANLVGLLCFGVISQSTDSNYEQCYIVREKRICYFTGSLQSYNWNDSREICDSINSSLPYFLNWYEQPTFNNYSRYLRENGLTISEVWTSGQSQPYDNWTWINGVEWNDRPDLAINTSETGTHVMLTGSQKLYALKPNNLSNYFCQYSVDKCDGTSNRVRLKNLCLEFPNKYDPWYEARNYCLEKEGDLAHDFKDEDIEAAKKLGLGHGQDVSFYKFWIGLRKVSWLWITNSKGQLEQVTFTNWFEDREYLRSSYHDLCIYADASSGRWRTSKCDETKSVICQRRERMEIIVSQTDGPISTDAVIQSTNYVTFGSVIGVAVLLSIGSMVVAALIVKRNSSMVNRDVPVDKQYQGLTTAMNTYSTPAENFDIIDENYDKIDDGHYDDIDNLASDSNYESIADAPYLDLADTPYLDILENADNNTYMKLQPQEENIVEQKA